MTDDHGPPGGPTDAGADREPGAQTREERFAAGMAVLTAVNGERGREVIADLAEVSPELAHQIVAWSYGDVYARPGLAPRDRQLVTIGILTALGGCEAELEVHIGSALDLGITPEQVTEALLHAAVYCGVPRALNATVVAKAVFTDRGLLPGDD